MDLTELSPRELRRYSRQIMLPGCGQAGQKKIRNASVLVVGAGGLGCPVLQYLAAAGVGKIGIVEFDMVDESNLQRQVLYGTLDVGKLKSIIARDRILHLNPNIELSVKNLRLTRENALEIAREFSIIIDATDNIETRYVINDACVILEKPMVHGSIFRSEGQVAVFNYNGGPTYRCYNPEIEGREFVNPHPSTVGLFGVLPGITGTLMANEVLKIITGSGDVISGKVLMFNIYSNTFRTVTVNRIDTNLNIKNM